MSTMHSSQQQKTSVMMVVGAELRCAVSTLLMLMRRQIRMPLGMVGGEIVFADGSRSQIYRETVRCGVERSPQVILAVRFRLRLIGSSTVCHALFRFESLFNTLLFAAHRGFHSKLWLTDRVTDHYRGIYEWQDAESAAHYAEILRVVLSPWVEAGSFAYRIIEGTRRAELLAGRVLRDSTDLREDLWWLPQRLVGMADRSHGT